MKKTKVGKESKKVFLIHGWMSSSKIFMKCVKDLENECEMTLIDLPGFGKKNFSTNSLNNNNFLESYKVDIIKILEKENFDLIIGHSLGGNLILRAIDDFNFKGNVILFNPCYKGIDYLKSIASMTSMNMFLFKFQSLLPRWIAKPLIKIFSVLSINKSSLINELIIDDVRKANPYVAAKVMEELIFDNWTFKNKNNIKNITIVTSEKDRLIKAEKINVLIKNIIKCRLIKLKNIGHTPILEDYDNFIKIIKDEIRKLN